MAYSIENGSAGAGQRAQVASSGSSRTGNELVDGKLSPATGKAPPVGKIQAEQEPVASLDDAVAKIQDYLQNTERSLDFRLDNETGITVVSVYDKSTNELIRQIPSEEAVSLAQKLNQEEPLSLFRAQV